VGDAVTVCSPGEPGSMNDNSDHRTEPVAGKRAYTAPMLQRFGTLKELTRSIGNKGNKDGQQTGNQKRTSW